LDYAFRHLQRWPLATSYAQIVADVADMLAKVPGAELVVNATDCGRPILADQKMSGRLSLRVE